MQEMGIDLSHHQSNTLDEISETMDYVFTVCSDAHETCPVFMDQTKVIHVGFDDPPRLTQHMSDEDEVLAVYRRVRDEIKAMVLHIESYLDQV